MSVVSFETIVCLSLPSKPHLITLGLETSVKNSHLQITNIKFKQIKNRLYDITEWGPGKEQDSTY